LFQQKRGAGLLLQNEQYAIISGIHSFQQELSFRTARTMQGSHPPTSPFLKPLFCGNSIFLLMLPNKSLPSAVDESL